MSKETTSSVEKRICEVLDDNCDQRKAASLLADLASIGVEVVTESADPGFSTGTYFGGFTTIAMMFQATEGKEYTDSQRIEFVRLIVSMAIHGIVVKEAQKDGE